MSKREIIRCLKRYVAREVFHALLDNALEHQTCALGCSRRLCFGRTVRSDSILAEPRSASVHP
jgi:hypothetical protein